MSDRRIQLQPAWVLHRRDFRDSSQIIELLTRDHGRLGVVARGIKRPKNRYRGLMQPFTSVLVSWVAGRGELATMTGAESGEGPVCALRDTDLMAGFYVNELILKLTHRFDPLPGVYQHYEQCLSRLASQASAAAVLRDFELDLLDELGFGLTLDIEARSGRPVRAGRHYDVVVDEGAIEVDSTHEQAIPGEVLLAVDRRDWTEQAVRQTARRLLARAIDRLLDGKVMQTRQVLREIRQNRARSGE